MIDVQLRFEVHLVIYIKIKLVVNIILLIVLIYEIKLFTLKIIWTINKKSLTSKL